ncbi:hypothetical protein FRC04_001444 [Tulasnella sp. 424]|nr:hypothetical protein FRC04_001444 [Tulasnella sp. 424]KAG8972718.1 hypothetical protein FRC05_009639 [Tulasnella sp. 425]
MIVSSLLLTTLAAVSAVLAAPATSNADYQKEARGVSRWSIRDNQSVPRAVPQIFDTGRSGLKNGKRQTNAQRMARGLPPLKPRKLYGNGSSAAGALQPRASPTPKRTILLYDSQGLSGTLLGYWSIGFTSGGVYPGCYYLTNTCSNSITNPDSQSSNALRNPDRPRNSATGTGYYYIGAATRSNKDASWDTSTGNSNVAFVSGVTAIGQNATPQGTVNHSYQEGSSTNNGDPSGDQILTESNIWDCSGANGECFPFWIDPSRDRKTAYLAYVPDKQNILVLTSDITMLRNEGSFGSATIVRMFLDDSYTCPN